MLASAALAVLAASVPLFVRAIPPAPQTSIWCFYERFDETSGQGVPWYLAREVGAGVTEALHVMNRDATSFCRFETFSRKTRRRGWRARLQEALGLDPPLDEEKWTRGTRVVRRPEGWWVELVPDRP